VQGRADVVASPSDEFVDRRFDNGCLAINRSGNDVDRTILVYTVV